MIFGVPILKHFRVGYDVDVDGLNLSLGQQAYGQLAVKT